VKFTGQVTPSVKKVTYKIDMKRVMTGKLIMGIGEGVVLADDKPIYSASGLRVGLFDAKDLV
ncbi:MAG: beta-hydroxydecanoyl-ACP dehydratase, partial [Asticcacaulis sp.]|nr:beta-hydroxydecanoyl-ACP dehydratase [Asticcacaulis sp.]